MCRAEFSKVYKRLDICLTEKGESFYQERMKGMMKDLIASGQLLLVKSCFSSCLSPVSCVGPIICIDRCVGG